MKHLLTYTAIALLILLMGSRKACAQESLAELLTLNADQEAVTPASSSTQPLGIRYTKKHPLIIVSDWGFPPYSYTDENGLPMGFEIDIIHEIFDRIHIPYEIHPMEWQKAKEQVASGKAHLMMEVMKDDEDRNLAYGNRSFCPYYVGIAYTSNSRSVQKLSDLLPTDTLAMIHSGFVDDYFKRQYTKPAFHIMYLSRDKIGEWLKGGNSRYYIWGERTLIDYARSYYNGSDMHVNRLIDFPEGSFRFCSTDKQLLKELDLMYDRLEKSNIISQTQQKWLDDNLENDNDYERLSIIAAIAVIVLIFVFLVLFFVFVTRGNSLIEELRQEYLFISDMSLALSDCDVIAFDVKRYRVRNIHGNILPEGEITMQEYEERIHPDDLLIENEVRAKVDDGAPEMPVVTYRMRHYGKGDEYRNLEACSTILHDLHGHPDTVFVAFNDITDHIREEKALELVEVTFSKAFDETDAIIAFYDLNGTMRLNNTNAERLFFPRGRDESANFMQSTRLFDLPFFRGRDFNLVDEEEVYACNCADIAGMKDAHYVEYRVRHVNDSNGKHIGYVVIGFHRYEERSIDVECKRLQRLVEQRAAALEEVKTSMHFVMEKSRITPFQYTKESDRLAFAPDREHYDFLMTGEEYQSAFIIDGDEDVHTWPVDEMLESKGAYHATRKLRSFCGEKYDTPHWFSINSIPVYDDKGTVVGGFGLAKDITKYILMQKNLRKETEKARDSVRQKSLFMANMTHELRTPLNAINGFADLLKVAEDDSQKEEYLEIMRQNCHFLIRLMDNIVQLSMMDTSGLTVKREQTEIYSALRNACQSLFSEYPLQEGVSYQLDIPEGELSLNVDFRYIMRILEELVSNASKYTSRGTVTVACRYIYGILTISCSDTGCGIPSDKTEAVFQRFVKLNEFVPGTGLGLVVAKNIAHHIGGSLTLQSVEGECSIFTLTLPVERIKDEYGEQ